MDYLEAGGIRPHSGPRTPCGYEESIIQALGRILSSCTSQRISVSITDSLMMPAWCSTTMLLGSRALATGVDAVVKGKPTQLPQLDQVGGSAIGYRLMKANQPDSVYQSGMLLIPGPP